MMTFSSAAIRAVVLILASIAVLRGEVRLPAIFGDHMVLQQTQKLPVWGTASPGEKITVSVGNETGHTKADADGKWRIDLPPLAAQNDPVTMTVKGTKNSVTFTDVLIGEVWLCSGQSNMQYPVKYAVRGNGGVMGGSITAENALPRSNDAKLRLFVVKYTTSLEPLTNVTGKWELCTPQTVATFSAVGYFFGHDLRGRLRRPVGLIGSYISSSPAQAWTSLSGLQKEPELQHYVTDYEKTKDGLEQEMKDYPEKQKAYEDQLKAWEQVPENKTYLDDYSKWSAAVTQLPPGSLRLPAPRQPSTPKPTPPPHPGGPANIATKLYNAMIAPLIPYAIRGVIWYQGEANAIRPLEYRTLFPCMIRDWREKWDEGDFPFLYVQLAAFHGDSVPTWPYLRESQLMTLSLPNTGMATAVDIGVPNYIHPADKEDVAYRLALAARHVAYGEKQLVYSGPIFDEMKIAGNTASLTFTHAENGLIIGKAPWVAPGFKPLPTDKLIGFTIAGADKNFVPANAHIEGGAVLVSSPQVTHPAAVRYDWANSPEGNLYNRDKLPASPFRTDNWNDPVLTNPNLVTTKASKKP